MKQKNILAISGIVIGIGGIVIGVIMAFSIFVYTERHPNLHVECYTLENGDPCVLECIVNNLGRGEAKDVSISFNNMMPLQTKVLAQPELGITIIESETLPNPQIEPELAKTQKAFAVHIPRIAPKDTITFRVATTHPDNQRAGKQIVRIRGEIINVLNDFGERLLGFYPDEAIKWDIELVIKARIKEENLFSPAKLSYEKGREDINYFTEEEKKARDINQDLYSRFKKEFIDIYQGRPEFKAPVIRIKTSDEESTLAMFPPYVNIYLDLGIISLKELEQKGEETLYPPVPESY